MKKLLFMLLALSLLFISCEDKAGESDNPKAIENSAPLADAGRKQSVLVGDTVTLDGSGSSDVDKDSLIFTWSVVSQGANTQLSDIHSAHPTFVATAEGTFTFTLVVADSSHQSAPESVMVEVAAQGGNASPIAHAGTDRTTTVSTVVPLDGSKSSDANGHTLTYTWSIVKKPAGSTLALTPSDQVSTSMSPDVSGVYLISLVVHDGALSSAPDTVKITATVASASQSDQLVAMGIDPADAAYLIANHPADVATVLADKNRIFKDLHSLSGMFMQPTDPDAAPFADPQFTQWNGAAQKKFTRMFGRFIFVINTPLFQQAFDQHIGLLNPAYQGTAEPFPTSFAQFKAQANKVLADNHNQFKFFLSNKSSWVANGMIGLLHLRVENIMFGPAAAGAPHNSEALMLHEVVHNFGYTHDGPDAEIISKPNTPPYYVQALVGMSYKDPSAAMVWDTPDALLTVYFGNDDF